MAGGRVVFFTFGSLGDLHPFLALAKEMRIRGLSPVIATTPAYRSAVESHGIGFCPVRPDLDVADPVLLARVMDSRTGGHFLLDKLVMPSLRNSYADSLAAADGADLLVTHPLALGAILHARRAKAVWASTALSPVSLYSVYDPPVMSGLPFAAALARMGPVPQRILLRGMSAALEPVLRPFRELERELGLPKSPNPLFWGHSPDLALGLFSPLLAPPQRDWPSSAHATGFPHFEHGTEPIEAIERFLDTGDAPIVFTLGSAAVGVAGDFFSESMEAVQRLGARAIVLAGRQAEALAAGGLPDGVLVVRYAPHGAVFPRASAIVHQGGIGTTGEAMRAGRPMLVVPYSHDQPDQAARLSRLGVGRQIPRRRYSAASAVREIQTLLGDPRYARRAAEIGARVRWETGVMNACDHLCRLLPRSFAHRPNRSPRTASLP